MRYAIAAMSLLLAGSPAAAWEDDPQLPEWMTGCWRQQQGEAWTEECWMAPRAGIMLGAARSGSGKELRDWEAMQIILDQPAGEGPVVRMAFWAAPFGQSRTLFAWSPSDEPGVSFFNAANDYPQRVRYWREGKRLMAEIAMADGSKPMVWRYERRN